MTIMLTEARIYREVYLAAKDWAAAVDALEACYEGHPTFPPLPCADGSLPEMAPEMEGPYSDMMTLIENEQCTATALRKHVAAVELIEEIEASSAND